MTITTVDASRGGRRVHRSDTDERRASAVTGQVPAASGIDMEVVG